LLGQWTVKEHATTIERKPVAHAARADLPGWIDALRAADEIRQSTRRRHVAIGALMRSAQGTGDGPALLFNTIKDYECALPPHLRLWPVALSALRGVAPDTHPPSVDSAMFVHNMFFRRSIQTLAPFGCPAAALTARERNDRRDGDDFGGLRGIHYRRDAGR
jgi:hypothetical protein